MKNLKLSSLVITVLLFAFLAPVWKASAQMKKTAATEISFTTKGYRQVLALAKASHKKIFVDAYATWCGPCRQLRKTTFKDARAAAYFNKNFINLAIDIEKGEGADLAKRWKIEALPTLLILDGRGNIIADHIGYVDGNGLIEFAKQASVR